MTTANRDMANVSKLVLRIHLESEIASEANARGHWRSGWRRAKAQKQEVAYRTNAIVPPDPPLLVVITRIYSGRKRAYDDDNAIRGAKAIRDAVAAWLGIDDADRDRVRYEVRQRREPAQGGTLVEIFQTCGVCFGNRTPHGEFGGECVACGTYIPPHNPKAK